MSTLLAFHPLVAHTSSPWHYRETLSIMDTVLRMSMLVLPRLPCRKGRGWAPAWGGRSLRGGHERHGRKKAWAFKHFGWERETSFTIDGFNPPACPFTLMLCMSEPYMLSLSLAFSGVSQLRPGEEGGYRVTYNPDGTGCGAAMRSMCIGLRYDSSHSYVGFDKHTASQPDHKVLSAEFVSFVKTSAQVISF